jgi:hypothetical protein
MTTSRQRKYSATLTEHTLGIAGASQPADEREQMQGCDVGVWVAELIILVYVDRRTICGQAQKLEQAMQDMSEQEWRESELKLACTMLMSCVC